SGTTINLGDDCVIIKGSDPIPIGYCQDDDIPYVYCECNGTFPTQTAGVGNPQAPGQGITDPYNDPGTAAQVVYNLPGKIFLSEVVQQVTPGSTQLVDFSTNGFDNPIFPYGHLTTETILKRNRLGQVAQVQNERGIITTYDYGNIVALQYYACPFFGDEPIVQQVYLRNNIGLPTKVTVGDGRPDKLETEYTYYPANTIKKIVDPNELELEYEYDGYYRVKEARRNGQLIQSYTYDQWGNDQSLDFASRALQNKVEAFNYVEGNTGWGDVSYVDPLGRSAGAVSYSGNSYVVQEDVAYDLYDRPIISKKSYAGSVPSIGGTLPSCGNAEMEYDLAPRSRTTKMSKFGECLTGTKVVEQTYCLVSSLDLTAEVQATG
ncbi:MAG: hypothetical protein AAFU60_17260, partial [Bacteroidota bacterium]